jgi:carbon storage regulator
VLVLSRKKDEKLLIGDDVVITIVDVRGDRVRLGIDAPSHERIDREEVRQRRTAEASETD